MCLSAASPLTFAKAPSALQSVGSDVILHALSQLVVEKGLIGRDELIERLPHLSGRGSGDGLFGGLHAEL
jgi:hypothetical protein